jgi:hypothetical protein
MKNKGLGFQYYNKKGMGGMKYTSGKKKMGSMKCDAYQYGGATYGKAKVMNIFAYFNP